MSHKSVKPFVRSAKVEFDTLLWSLIHATAKNRKIEEDTPPKQANKHGTIFCGHPVIEKGRILAIGVV